MAGAELDQSRVRVEIRDDNEPTPPFYAPACETAGTGGLCRPCRRPEAQASRSAAAARADAADEPEEPTHKHGHF